MTGGVAVLSIAVPVPPSSAHGPVALEGLNPDSALPLRTGGGPNVTPLPPPIDPGAKGVDVEPPTIDAGLLFVDTEDGAVEGDKG